MQLRSGQIKTWTLLSNLQILKLTPFFSKLIYSAKFHPYLPLPHGFTAISDENSEWPGIQSKQMSSGKAGGGIGQLLIPPCPLDLPFFLLCLRGHILRGPGKTEEKGIIVLPVRKLESGKECLGELKKKIRFGIKIASTACLRTCSSTFPYQSRDGK